MLAALLLNQTSAPPPPVPAAARFGGGPFWRRQREEEEPEERFEPEPVLAVAVKPVKRKQKPVVLEPIAPLVTEPVDDDDDLMQIFLLLGD